MRTVLKSAAFGLLASLAATATSWAEIALEPDSPFKTYTVDDGLSQTRALAVVQDAAGYLWIGTYGGLDRFDGAMFENLTTRHGLRENFVQGLYVDSSDRVWVGDSSGGLTMLEKGRVSMTIDPPEDHLGTVFKMYEHRGYLYMGLEPNGVTRLSLSNPHQGIESVSLETGMVQRIAAPDDQELLSRCLSI